MSDKKRIPRPPFYASEYIDMAESLECIMELFGQLIVALMTYIVDGTIPEHLPAEVKPLFTVYRKKIDYANGKYEQTCEKNKKNGKNGGRPRKKVTTDEQGEAAAPLQAEPPKKAIPRIKMPPTEAQFTKLLKERQADGLVSDGCDPEEFFEWAEALKWKVNGEPAQNVGDFLAYAAARHPTEEIRNTIPASPPLSTVYGIIFKELHGLRDGEGNTGALVAAIDFLKAYDSCWSFHGETFTDNQWREALEAFMQGLKTE